MRKILIGFDGSDCSEQAINKALTLVEKQGELILLAVIPDQSDKMIVDKEINKHLKQKAEQIIEDLIKDIGQSEYTLIGMVEEGDPASIIIDLANKLNVDLIVLGSKGTSALGKYLLGSVANKVVQYAHKPVMVVR